MPVVVITGRPNVGKSTLFNKMIGRRKALVFDVPGVTRDLQYGEAFWGGKAFTVVDTGGISFEDGTSITAGVHKQAITAVKNADLIICLFDGRSGLTPADYELVSLLRKSGKPVIYVVNKIDTPSNDYIAAAEFSSLGIEPIIISAEHSRNLDLLLDLVISRAGSINIPEEETPPDIQRQVKAAIIGRPNVGKSTLINRLCNDDRMLVHEFPGTTRDSVDVEVIFGKDKYIFVDTAGIRKKAKTKDVVEKLAVLKSLRAVEDAEVVFVVIDVLDGVTHEDLSLISHSFNLYKPTALLVNKMDLVDVPKSGIIEKISACLGELEGIPIIPISGKTGCNCGRIFKMALMLKDMSARRIPTSKLNRFFARLKQEHPAPDFKGKQITMNYITQTNVSPPVFVVFTNKPGGIINSYKKFLAKRLMGLFGDVLIPVVLKFKSKG